MQLPGYLGRCGERKAEYSWSCTHFPWPQRLQGTAYKVMEWTRSTFVSEHEKCCFKKSTTYNPKHVMRTVRHLLGQWGAPEVVKTLDAVSTCRRSVWIFPQSICMLGWSIQNMTDCLCSGVRPVGEMVACIRETLCRQRLPKNATHVDIREKYALMVETSMPRRTVPIDIGTRTLGGDRSTNKSRVYSDPWTLRRTLPESDASCCNR